MKRCGRLRSFSFINKKTAEKAIQFCVSVSTMEIRGHKNSQRIHCSFLWVLLIACFFTSTLSENENDQLSNTPGLPTVTVRGFLNFKTTVDGTVIVFTPASEVHHPATQPKIAKTSSEVLLSSISPSKSFIPKEDLTSDKEMHEAVQDLAYASPPQSAVKTQIPNLNLLENKMKEPFLQHISDNAVLPSTGLVNNDLDKIKKLSSSQNQYPTGLVTVLGGTFVDGTSTTVFETQVIGTYIDGKYAQILQSTSSIVAHPTTSMTTTPMLSYSTVQRSQNKATEQVSSTFIKLFSSSSSIITLSLNSASTFIEPLKPDIPAKTVSIIATPTLLASEISKSVTIDETTKTFIPKTNEQIASSVTKNENTVSIFPVQTKSQRIPLESSFIPTSVTVTFDNEQPTESLESVIRSTFLRPKSSFIPFTTTMVKFTDDDNTLSTTQKNPRNNTSRTRFHSPRRPSQSVRLNRFKVKLTLRHDSTDEYNVTVTADDEDLEEDHTNKTEDDVEVVTEGLGMEVDPAKVVFQETTITSEVTLHVGRRKSIRTLTITTSVPLTVHPTDIQDILAAESTSMEREASDANSNHHIVTRTFTTTERALKTSVVPVFDGKSTAYHTVTESFFIMKIITAYRTLPLGDASVLESIFEDSEVSETTLEAAANIQPSVIQSAPPEQYSAENPLQPSMVLPSIGKAPPQHSNPFLSLGHALSNNPLAAVYLGLQQLNAQITLYSTITDTSTYLTTKTFYNTKTIRFYDGRSTRYRTVSDPTSTKKITVTTTITSVQPYLNTHALQQQQQLQKLIGSTRLAPPEPEYSTLTTIYTTVTTTTSLSPRIYTLIYNGFSTKFRTVTSTTIHPTTITLTTTTKVQIAPTNVPFTYPYSI